MTPVLALKPDWKVRTASVPLNAASARLEVLVERLRPGDRADGPAAHPELADGREGRLAQARVMGQARGSRSRRG